MSQQLPERANLAHLRKQAKDLLQAYRNGDPDAVGRLNKEKAGVPRLHDVHRVLAREYGFPSWRQLVEHVEAQWADQEQEFVEGTWRGEAWWRTGPAKPDRRLAEHSPAAALMSGDVRRVRLLVSRDRDWVRKPLAPRNLAPLLYVCFSGCLQDADARAAVVETARVLLEAGADPNATYAYDQDRNSSLSCLYGAAGVNGCVELAEMLLDAGANPDDGESLYHSAERDDPACLELLLSRGATIEGSNALPRLLDFERPREVRIMLKAGAKVDAGIVEHAIVRGRSAEIVRMLLRHVDDVRKPGSKGLTPKEAAVATGREDLLALLEPLDERPLSTEWTAIRHALNPGLGAAADAPVTFTQAHRRCLELAASRNDAPAIERLVALGIDPNSTEPYNGATALHSACWNGHADAVRALLKAGASVDVQDRMYQGYPLGWLCVGSAQNKRGDFVAVAKLLVEAGHRFRSEADPEGPAIGRGASDDVQAFLRSAGAIWDEA